MGLYVCVCVCVNVCVHIYIYIYTYIHTYTHTYIHIHTHIHTHFPLGAWRILTRNIGVSICQYVFIICVISLS